MLEKNLTRFVLPKDLKLLNIKISSKGYTWICEKIRQEFEICPKCATPSNTRAGRCKVKVRDEGLRGEILYLQIHKHRYFCKSCKKTFTEPVSLVWPRRRTTQRFRKALAKDCHNFSNMSKVRRKNKVSSGLMYQVYFEQVKTKLRERMGQSWPTHLGIDEHFFRRKKGYSQFVTMFTDLKKRKLFEVAEGKSGKTLIEQLNSMPGRLNVKVVAIDLSSSYRAFVKKMFPNAIIVSDKFHVLRLLTGAIMAAGKKVEGHKQLLKTRKLLLRNRKKLDYFLRVEIDHYLKDKPHLNEIYRTKEQLFELYRTKGFNRASTKLNKIIQNAKNSNLKPLNTLAKTLSKWRHEILRYFLNPWTNALTEALNNTGKLVQKQGYGYKSFVNYRLRLLSACFF